MEYEKDFDDWNEVKKGIEKLQYRPHFREKEIWWCCVGVNIGSEQDGKGKGYMRPVLILKKTSYRTFIGISITKTLREDSEHIAFYFEYDLHTMIINQIRNYDSKRLKNKMGTISNYLFDKTKKMTIRFLN